MPWILFVVVVAGIVCLFWLGTVFGATVDLKYQDSDVDTSTCFLIFVISLLIAMVTIVGMFRMGIAQ